MISNADNSFDEQIDESQLSPCMKQILNTLRNQNSGSVTDIVNQFSGNDPGFNWKVVDGSLSGQTGSTSTSCDYVNEMLLLRLIVKRGLMQQIYLGRELYFMNPFMLM